VIEKIGHLLKKRYRNAGIAARETNDAAQHGRSGFFNANRFSRAATMKAENVDAVLQRNIERHAFAAGFSVAGSNAVNGNAFAHGVHEHLAGFFHFADKSAVFADFNRNAVSGYSDDIVETDMTPVDDDDSFVTVLLSHFLLNYKCPYIDLTSVYRMERTFLSQLACNDIINLIENKLHFYLLSETFFN